MSVLDMNINSFLKISRSISHQRYTSFYVEGTEPVGKQKTREIAYEVNTYINTKIYWRYM